MINTVRLVSRRNTKPTKWPIRPAKTQISLGICTVWSDSSLFAWKNLMSSATPWAHSNDLTGRTPRLIRAFAGHTCHFVGFVVRRISYCLTRCKMLRTFQSSLQPDFTLAVCAMVDTARCIAVPSPRCRAELPTTTIGFWALPNVCIENN